ncbi:hypothetical protein [Streptomyces sp. NRRL S-1022]|uniref:hypothetical protein n=1 Tax=Streptomyces sp. NRRL S-1022 TaxID=1463880 RepID=UPI000AF73E3D|nr:hypothetical protein [Streptomyces sp. NRRL S-1022]
MSNRTLMVTASLGVMSLMALTACGTDKSDDPKASGGSASATAEAFKGLTGDQISEKARVAMTKLDSFRVKGSMTTDGKHMTFDFAVAKRGACQGTFGTESASAEIRQVGGAAYMKGDEKFWREMGSEDGSSSEDTEALIEMLKGRWFKMPAQDAKADDKFPFCDIGTMFEKDEKEGHLTRKADTDVNGTPAVTLKGKDGAATQTLLVAAEGEPYALRLTAEGGKEPGSFDFSAFNKPVTVTAPPAGEVMDPEKLKG